MGTAPNVEQYLSEMSDGQPRRDERTLIRQGRSALTVTLMKRAWEDSGHDLDDPGEIVQWYYPEDGVVLIDLEGPDE